LSRPLVVIERDFRLLFSDRFLMVVMFVNFAIDLGVSGLSLAAMIRGLNYFVYIAPGANLVTATVAAFQSGRDIWRERVLTDVQPYLLTLPVPKARFALSRLLSGMLRSTVTVIPGTVVISLLYRLSFPLFLAGVLIVWVYSAAVIGLSVVAASMANSLELFTTVRSTVQVYLSFFSTQFYPASILPPAVRLVSSFNPMTWAVESFRALGSGSVDLPMISALAALSSALLFVGFAFYRRSMEF
jgi:ABC-2 type transport system permease protein